MLAIIVTFCLSFYCPDYSVLYLLWNFKNYQETLSLAKNNVIISFFKLHLYSPLLLLLLSHFIRVQLCATP